MPASACIPPGFADGMLDIAVRHVTAFYRIFKASHPNPLGFGKTQSRFADPRPLAANQRFGVVYLGQTLKGCFVEAILRDRAAGSIGTFLLTRHELEEWRIAQISSSQPLRLVDLRGDGMLRMRVSSDALRGRDHSLGMTWSLAFYQHREAPDGILYNSRLNESLNVAVYDRAVRHLRCDDIVRLLDCAALADILDTYRIDLL
jgi:hypothetical protein